MSRLRHNRLLVTGDLGQIREKNGGLRVLLVSPVAFRGFEDFGLEDLASVDQFLPRATIELLIEWIPVLFDGARKDQLWAEVAGYASNLPAEDDENDKPKKLPTWFGNDDEIAW